MSEKIEKIGQDIDDCLCAFFDITDCDNVLALAIIEYCHNNKKEIAESVEHLYCKKE